MTNASPSRKLQALILAGWRNESREDPLSQVNSVHKAFIDIGGVYMIERVIQTLQHIDSIDEICISAPQEIRSRFEGLQRSYQNLRLMDASTSPAASIEMAVGSLPDDTQLLVTTCDHALLTPEMVQYFLDAIDRESYGVAAACVLQDIFTAAFPNASRTFVRFNGFTFSGANLFWLKKGASEPLVHFWRQLEMHRKKPVKMANQIGLMLGMQYLSGTLTKEKFLKKIEQKTSVKADLIPMPYPKAAIDVDKPKDLELVRSIIQNGHLTQGVKVA